MQSKDSAKSQQIGPTCSLCLIYLNTLPVGGTWWHSWLRHCATSRKFVGSILDGVIEIFRLHDPSGCTMALGLTQPLVEMSTRHISWRVR